MTSDKQQAALLDAAVQVVAEFVEFGEVLQTDRGDHEYGPDSAIERLRTAIRAIDPDRIDAAPELEDFID